MNKFLSKRVLDKPKTKGRVEMIQAAAKKEDAGEELIYMNVGKPDFDTPKIIKDGAIKALNEGAVHYTRLDGIPKLKRAISDREKREFNLSYDPVDEITVTVGASAALYAIWTVFLDNEDELMIPTPYYNAYREQINYIGAKYVEVPILKGDKIEYRREDFEKKLTKNTKMIIINSPNNPSGYVMTDKDLQMIADFAIENDLLVISDESYDKYVFNGEFKSIANLKNMRERTIIVNSASKTFSMTGWRIGYVMGPKELVNEISIAHNAMSICPNSFSQHGAYYAYKDKIEEVNLMLDDFKNRKEYIVGELEKIKEFKFVKPEGAFYVFINVGGLGLTGMEFCEDLLNKKGIVLAPGHSYGDDWIDYVRISYACSMDNIKKTIKYIKEYISELK